jgi:phage nucleotide-binding protein
MKIQSSKSISINRLKFLIYGEPGVGKTTLAATLKEPTLLISAEAGLLSLQAFDIDTVDITMDDEGAPIKKEKRAARLGEVYTFLCGPEAREKYKWVFIDSLTEISQNLIESLYEIYPDPKDGLKLWGDYAKKARSLIKTFRDLPYYNIVFTALDKVEKDENNRRYKTVDMQGKIGNQLPAYFDEVFHYAKTEDTDGNLIRVLLTDGYENVIAKDRSGKLNKQEAPNLQNIANKMRGPKEKTKTTKGVK